MKTFIEINGRRIGPGFPVYLVAEISGNHNQDFDQAVRMIEAAKESGADAVKLQTYTPDTLTIECDNSYFQIKGGTLWDNQSLYKLYTQTYTPWEWQPKLKEITNRLGLDLFSTPFDFKAVDFLSKMHMPAYKIASFEVVDLPLISKIASTGKPIIMSTGMATLAEIREAVSAIREKGGNQLALLKCTSAYPAPPNEMNLRTIPDLAKLFGVPVGLSDHTLGVAVPIAAVTLGACIVEKHFTLLRDMRGPDSVFSLEPHEFKIMTEAVRTAEKSLGKVQYGVSDSETASQIFRRSLFIVKDMKTEDIFTEENVRAIRPGYGLHTRYFSEVIGRHASKDIKRGTPLDWGLVSGTGEIGI